MLPKYIEKAVEKLPDVKEVDILQIPSYQRLKNWKWFDGSKCWLCGGLGKITHPWWIGYNQDIFPALETICITSVKDGEKVEYSITDVENFYFESHSCKFDTGERTTKTIQCSYHTAEQRIPPEIECPLCNDFPFFFPRSQRLIYYVADMPSNAMRDIIGKYGRNKTTYATCFFKDEISYLINSWELILDYSLIKEHLNIHDKLPKKVLKEHFTKIKKTPPQVHWDYELDILIDISYTICYSQHGLL